MFVNSWCGGVEMSSRTTTTSIKVTGGALQVQGDLGFDEEKPFSTALQELMATEYTELVIDLSDVRYLSSLYAGEIALMLVRAGEQDRPTTVRVTDKVAHILLLCGIDTLGKVEIVE
jgi:anti-anti-sigma regulatory factor